MLGELSIRHFGIIESVDLSFDKGMTVITGETGAGKSMIIDAIGLLIGGRGSAEFVRHGAEKAEIEGLFYIDNGHPCREELASLGLETDDEMIVLRREISKAGKSVCRINGKMVTLAALKQTGKKLIDIHGQHEHQDLLQSERHLSLLDNFGGTKVDETSEKYRERFESYVELRKRWKQLHENEKEAAQRIDLIRFQVEEIDEAALVPNEDEQLEEERAVLANYERVFAALKKSYESLNGEQRGLEWVGEAMQSLSQIANVNDDYRQMHERLADHYYLLEEMTFSIRDTFESLAYDPERLNELESRLHDLQKLKKKYGDSVNDILAYRRQAAAELDQLTNRDRQVEETKAALASIKEQLRVDAKRLTEARKETANRLIEAITNELAELQMAKTRFDVQFSERSDFARDGLDDVEFLISTNPGEPLKPLARVASGGELSRIMLALKSIFSKGEGITSIIFDEVDTGVSGRAAQAMAEKIHRLSAHSQVFCITHLPQVAAMADTHLFITKKESRDRTITSVESLNTEQQIDEIGRMISGAEMTELTKQHAKELLDLAGRLKSTV
ncbi:MAG TPA: DNA repair protein RecN [Bacillales bacterium]|nr:DNA repair protein RecN [Bacillales bacterium]